MASWHSMHAENVLLTHFSARYPKMPPDAIFSHKRITEKEPILGLAFDNARVKIGTMRKLNMYLAAIEQSFQEEGDEDSNINIARVVDVDVE
jgi:ribonuclease Z